MKITGVLLLIVGSLGFLAGLMMFGDIGVAAMIGSIVGILSGIGFLQLNKALKGMVSINQIEPST